MGTTTIRVSKQTRDQLHDLAQAAGVSLQAIVERAIETYRRDRILAETNSVYAKLRNDSSTWNEIQAEATTFDGTLGDGLPED